MNRQRFPVNHIVHQICGLRAIAYLSAISLIAQRSASVQYLVRTMNFVLKTMNFALKTMNFVLKTMNFASQTMNFLSKMQNRTIPLSHKPHELELFL